MECLVEIFVIKWPRQEILIALMCSWELQLPLAFVAVLKLTTEALPFRAFGMMRREAEGRLQLCRLRSHANKTFELEDEVPRESGTCDT